MVHPLNLVSRPLLGKLSGGLLYFFETLVSDFNLILSLLISCAYIKKSTVYNTWFVLYHDLYLHHTILLEQYFSKRRLLS